MSKWPYRDYLDAMETRSLNAIETERAKLKKREAELSGLRSAIVNRGIQRAKKDPERRNVPRETLSVHVNTVSGHIPNQGRRDGT